MHVRNWVLNRLNIETIKMLPCNTIGTIRGCEPSNLVDMGFAPYKWPNRIAPMWSHRDGFKNEEEK
jgi:hypothetical protein